MFSRGRLKVTDLEGNVIEDDPLIRLIENPNPQQSKHEFLYNHLLYKSLGNNYINVKGTNPKNIATVVALFNLNQDYIDFEKTRRQNQFIFSPSDVREYENLTVDYRFYNTSQSIRVGDLIVYNDLPNSLKNNDSLIRGCSRVDSLVPALSNIEVNQQSKNINLKFAGTFIVSNQAALGGVNTPLDPEEKRKIENLLSGKNIIATKQNLKNLSMANDLQKLLFDENFAGDILKIGQAYGMNRDVLNYFASGSTFENIKEAIVQWIQNDIQFEGQLFASAIESYFGYRDLNRKVTMTYDHLPMMQVIEKQRAEKINLKADAVTKLVNAGVELEAALQLVGININENMTE